MKMTIEKLREHIKGKLTVIPNMDGSTYKYREPVEWVQCKDGESLSVQAGGMLYSTPREDHAKFTHVEVGYPTATVPDSWLEYGDGNDEIFGYIPIEMVVDYINDHGGVK